MKSTFIAAILLLVSVMTEGGLSAQNPIVQTCYTSDPAPMVHDGTLYVYTGHDEDKADFFWMQEWRVYSTKDMVNWTDHGSPLAIESFDWADDRAWASQCIERNGKFDKDKNSERSKKILPEEATHFSDAADKRIWTKYGKALYTRSSGIYVEPRL